MTSFRQTQANRDNAGNSTGPITEEGKQRSRCNAVRHGLTAETVIGALEDAEDYKAFEAAITADYDAQSAVKRELVLRLASLLWRLRRATTMETGLFEIQADQLSEFSTNQVRRPKISMRCWDRPRGSASSEFRLLAALPARRKPCPAPRREPPDRSSVPPLSSRVAFCVSPICLTSRSIALADMKQPFGGKRARSCLRSMLWIVANHMKEGAVFMLAGGKNHHLSTATNVDVRVGDRQRLAKNGFVSQNRHASHYPNSVARLRRPSPIVGRIAKAPHIHGAFGPLIHTPAFLNLTRQRLADDHHAASVEFGVMGSANEYQNRARRCAEQAQIVSSTVDRARWRQLADQWMALSRMPLRKDDPAWRDGSAATAAKRHQEH